MQEHYGVLVAYEPNVLAELGLILTGFGTDTGRKPAANSN